MSVLITQATDEQSRATAAKLLEGPCVECGGHAGVKLLIDSDHEEGPFCLCAAPCGQRLGIRIEKLQPHLLAALSEDAHAERVIFLFELARFFNAGRVPLSRRALFREHEWAQA